MTKKILIILVLFLSSCSLPGLGGNTKNNDVVISGGDTAERRIMAEILVQMINHYDPSINTSIIDNLGTTMLIVQTITREDANASSVMYTGTSLTGELQLEVTTDVNQAFWSVVEGYNTQFEAVWFPSYGFGNTYAFMVTKDFQEETGVTSLSDLQSYASKLRIGVDTSWISRQGDGYEDFKRIYGYDFKEVLPMSIGLVYSAVEAGEMDVVLGYSTDGRIDAYDLVLLDDDKKLFPPYDASPVITKKVLSAHPILEEIVLKLEGTIDETLMQAMNRQHDEMRVEASVIAQKFLEINNYFEDIEPIPLREREGYNTILGGHQ